MKTFTGSATRWLPALALTLFCLTAQAQLPPVLSLPFTAMEQGITTYFVAPQGSGDMSGKDEQNALRLHRLEPFIRDLKISARIVLLPGQYDLTSTLDLVSDEPNQLVVLEGRPGAVIHGNFNPQTESGLESGLRLLSGNVIVRNLHFKQTAFCIKAYKNATVEQVLIENIMADNTHTCISVDRDVRRPVTRWIIRNLTINGYFRSGIRLAGSLSEQFLVENTEIDGARQQSRSDCHKGGIQLLAGVRNVHVRNTVIKNNIGECGEGYQQGDGIEADHTNGIPTGIRLENLVVGNSGDADLDLKAMDVSMFRVAALGGPETGYAFKLWHYDYQCDQCYATGPHAAFIQLAQARLTMISPVLTNDQPVHVCDLRHGTAPDAQARVTFKNARVYLADEEWINECGEGVLAAVTRLPQGRIAPPHPPDLQRRTQHTP